MFEYQIYVPSFLWFWGDGAVVVAVIVARTKAGKRVASIIIQQSANTQNSKTT
jgi:hypothetical protein